jgi:hypothetical protein
MGLVPARAAKAASERNRPVCDRLTSTWAALGGPTPRTSSSQGATAPTGAVSSTCKLVGLGPEQLDAVGSGPQRPHGGLVLERPAWAAAGMGWVGTVALDGTNRLRR